MELRWNGVPSLGDAARMLREQAQRTPPPQWVISEFFQLEFAESAKIPKLR
jgi:predicted amidohydrolase YtcJ